MDLFGRLIKPPILASFFLVAFSAMTSAQMAGEKPSPAAEPSKADLTVLKKKAREAEVRIRANQDDADQLKRAVKTNEVASAKEVLLRNGFTAKDLDDAKIRLQTGGGKGGEDQINISVACCDPKEITIQRSLENFTK